MLSISLEAFTVPTNIEEGYAVVLSAQASGGVEPLTYSWDFGDGTSDSDVGLVVVDHAYDANDPVDTPYTVTLTVSDGVESISRSAEILVENRLPVIDAAPDVITFQETTVSFNGEATDPGPSMSDIVSIEWDFDYQGTFTADSSGSLTATHTYNAPGSFIAALRVTDRAGAQSLAFTGAEVRPTGALTINAGPDQSAGVGVPIAFAGSISGDETVSLSSVAWDFAYDGTFDPAVTGTLSLTHTFTSPGTYQVALRATGSHTISEIDVLTVTADYTGPTADAGADRTVTAGDTVTFNGSHTDPDGTVAPDGIAWDFSYDGTFTADTAGTMTPS